MIPGLVLAAVGDAVTVMMNLASGRPAGNVLLHVAGYAVNLRGREGFGQIPWFLTCLFVMEIMAYALVRIADGKRFRTGIYAAAALVFLVAGYAYIQRAGAYRAAVGRGCCSGPVPVLRAGHDRAERRQTVRECDAAADHDPAGCGAPRNGHGGQCRSGRGYQPVYEPVRQFRMLRGGVRRRCGSGACRMPVTGGALADCRTVPRPVQY